MFIKLTFHGRVNEIGGNKVLLEDEDAKIFLDFGKNFEKEREIAGDISRAYGKILIC